MSDPAPRYFVRDRVTGHYLQFSFDDVECVAAASLGCIHGAEVFWPLESAEKFIIKLARPEWDLYPEIYEHPKA